MRYFFFRPLLLPILIFLSGIFLAGYFSDSIFPFRSGILITFLVALLVLSIIYLSSSKAFYVFIALFFFVMGVFRYATAAAPSFGDIGLLADEEPEKAVVYGAVYSVPEFFRSDRYESLRFDLKIRKVIIDGNERSVSGKLRAQIYEPGKKAPGLGDRIVMSGKLFLSSPAMNPGSRDFSDISLKTGTRARFSSSRSDIFGITVPGRGPIVHIRRTLSDLRRKASLKLRKTLSGEALSMAESVTLGIRSGIKASTGDLLKRTGTAHILAVSGLHVGIAAVIILLILRVFKFPRSWVFIPASLGMLGFALFTGFRASSSRAAIMGSMLVLSSSLHRKPDIVNSLAVSAFIINFFAPGELFQPGFILSYIAVMSIIVVTPLTDTLLSIRPETRGLSGKARSYFLKSVSVSLSVWAGTMPLAAGYFGVIAPSCVLANIIAVAILFAMVVSSGLIIVLPVWPAISFLNEGFSFFMSVLTLILLKSMGHLASMPGSFVRVSPPGEVITGLYYAALVFAIAVFRKRRNKLLLAAFFLFAANLFVWKEVSLIPDENTKVTFFSTGRSDAAVLEFSDGTAMLVDSGSSDRGSGGDSGRNVVAPYLASRGIRRIDCAVITHPHEDHIGGLAYILDNFKVGAVIDSGDEEGGKASGIYRELLSKIEKRNIPRLSVKTGDRITGFSYAGITVLNPPGKGYYGDANNDSIALKMDMKSGGRILFSADTGSDAIKGMLASGLDLKSDVLKVPHHAGGLGDSTVVAEFLDTVDAGYMIVTNKRGCRLEKAVKEKADHSGAQLLVTGETGAVTVKFSPAGIEIDTFKPEPNDPSSSASKTSFAY